MPTFTRFDVAATDSEGNSLLTGIVAIDSADRTITIPLSEWADPSAVRVTDYELSEGSTLVNPTSIPDVLDLTDPKTVTLELYERQFEWTISATQTIERYFTVASQIGSSQIDVENHTVTAYIPDGQPLTAVQVKTLKLAGATAVMDPDLVGKTVDFTEPVKVKVSEFGRDTEWTITVLTTEVSVAIERVDPWTNVAWVYGAAETGKKNGFEYRAASAEEWTEVPADWITENGGSFSACLRHLDAMTDYVVRATSDSEFSAEVKFTTESAEQLPDADFTNWWLNGKVWCPWAENGESFWDTGNRGAATLGQSNVLPIDDPSSVTGYQGAMLQTRFIGVSILGKLGAGSLFAGRYVRTDGTNGVLAFGREFNRRPTAVKARLKFTTAPISHASKSNPDFTPMLGQPDTCIVWCALADTDQPFEIRTKPTDRQLFDRNDPGVIAYGQMQSGNSIEEYTDVIIPLDYNATDRVPRYLLLTASASKYGDYFTGGAGATLWILSYELLYDY